MRNKPKGMLQVYTGTGKGKTTAALGLAFRALGHKKRVFLLQFMKKGTRSGELRAARKFKNLKVAQAGQKKWAQKGKVTAKEKQLARKGLEVARQALESEKYDLVILDELNVALDYDLLKLEEVKEILKSRPHHVEVVITGRYAHPDILEMADLVSEVRELKHYYENGITQRAGIEY